MILKIFNTLNRKKEEFKPAKDKIVKMYVCGPTVYDWDHLGHARVGIFYDIVRRYLISQGYKVIFVQNITDVGHLTENETGQDKIEKKAKAENKTPHEIAKYFENEHFRDFEILNILKPDYSPRATEYIGPMIKFIKTLIDKKFAYETYGSVYFDITKFQNYGKLSGRDINEQKAGVRIKVELEKKHPGDFALWQKATSDHLMQWDSPWSRGFPGWHIECSTMIREILGNTIDIHGGAIELAFPHHENEIAQSEAAIGKKFVRYWLHIGLITRKAEKMAKSTGNFIYIRDALKKYHPDAIRIAILSTQYRKPLDWTDSIIKQAENIRRKLLAAKTKLHSKMVKSKIIKKANLAMADNFNTPKAFELFLENINHLSKDDFNYLNKIFGLKLEIAKISNKIKKIVTQREKARANKDFQQADILRQKIQEEGYQIEDLPSGPRVRKI